MNHDFVSEPITPVPSTMATRRMARGEPGLPQRFVWRDHQYTVADVVKTWKTTSGCKSGSDEQYVRKHWFTVRTTSGHEMTLYFERQPRSSRQRLARWWLYTVAEPDHE